MHVDTPIKTALARIKNRGNGYEQDISVGYLSRLDFYYHKLLQQFRKLGSQVHTIDGTLPEQNVVDRAKHIIDEVREQPPYIRHLTITREEELNFGPKVSPAMRNKAI